MADTSSEEKICAHCNAVLPPAAEKCPTCGAAATSKPPANPLWQVILFVAVVIAGAKFGAGIVNELRASSPVLNVVFLVLGGLLVLFGFYVLFKAIAKKGSGGK